MHEMQEARISQPTEQFGREQLIKMHRVQLDDLEKERESLHMKMNAMSQRVQELNHMIEGISALLSVVEPKEVQQVELATNRVFPQGEGY
jgi:hypothetical protein